MRTSNSFNDFSKKIRFLQEIPHGVSSQLATDEFYYPDESIEKARRELERLFGQYVMTYNANVFRKDLPLETHLCANYKGADLTTEQISVLRFYETKLEQKNVRFVIYQKPLEAISIEENPFFV